MSSHKTYDKNLSPSRRPLWKETFLEILSQTGNVTVAAQRANIDRRRVYQARKKDPVFREKWQDALEASADLMEAEAFRRAMMGVEKPVYYQGEVRGHIREYSDVLLIFLLKAIRPHKFRERYEMNVGDPFSALAEATGQPREQVMAALKEIGELEKKMLEKAEVVEDGDEVIEVKAITDGESWSKRDN